MSEHKADGEVRPLLLAYVHTKPDTLESTRELLREYVDSYAHREGYELVRVYSGVEGHAGERLTVARLVGEIEQLGVSTVLLAGPSSHALLILGRMTSVKIVTLADVVRRG